MGTSSYILVGEKQAMHETWGSTCHGAGRVLSRSAARRQAQGRAIGDELAQEGIHILARGHNTLAEEMPEAYKDIDQVVSTVEQAGLSRRVAHLRPLAVIKG
jgi:tRNA-splicing ligase RtcB